jgi:hypothetical protein
MCEKLNRRNWQRGIASRKQILAALQGRTELSRGELMRATGLSYDQVRNQCLKLSMRGKIVRACHQLSQMTEAAR